MRFSMFITSYYKMNLDFPKSLNHSKIFITRNLLWSTTNSLFGNLGSSLHEGPCIFPVRSVVHKFLLWKTRRIKSSYVRKLIARFFFRRNAISEIAFFFKKSLKCSIFIFWGKSKLVTWMKIYVYLEKQNT